MLDLIAEHKDVVKAFQIYSFEQEGALFRFKAELTLVDDSKIFMKEYVFENRERKYAYHWSDALGNLICRWDNAGHWPNISTFPHHKHIGDQVIESTDISLADVLHRVRQELRHESDLDGPMKR